MRGVSISAVVVAVGSGRGVCGSLASGKPVRVASFAMEIQNLRPRDGFAEELSQHQSPTRVSSARRRDFLAAWMAWSLSSSSSNCGSTPEAGESAKGRALRPVNGQQSPVLSAHRRALQDRCNHHHLGAIPPENEPHAVVERATGPKNLQLRHRPVRLVLTQPHEATLFIYSHRCWNFGLERALS